MAPSGITPFWIVVARVVRFDRSGLAGSNFENDFETCIGRGRWLSFFRPFEDAMKSGNLSSSIASVIAHIVSLKGEKLKGELPKISSCLDRMNCTRLETLIAPGMIGK
jgi:hypothetical protein